MSDELDVIEAAYRIDAPVEDWLAGIGLGFYEQFGAGLGLYGCEFHLDEEGRVCVDKDMTHDMPASVTFDFAEMIKLLPPQFIALTFARCDCATQAQLIDAATAQLLVAPNAFLAQFGWNETLGYSGIDPNGNGVALLTWLPAKKPVPPPLRERWARTSVHLASALRLRRRLSATGTPSTPDSAEAVLAPSGRVEGATGEAKLQDARQVLGDAVRRLESARGRLRRDDPDAAVGSWKGLVETRWSLVDHFESDGKRYVLAHRNEVRLEGLDALTERERQVVAFAALGHTNKLIAYELGITPSTVAVLVHRARNKLRAGSRAELIVEYQRLTRAPGGSQT